MLYGNGFELNTRLRMSPLKWDMSQPSEMFIAREIKHESRWYQISRLFIISNSWNLIPHIVLLISRLPEIIQKCFCTPDRAMDPTFQMNQPSSMFLAGETVSSEWFSKVRFFFQHPLCKILCNFFLFSKYFLSCQWFVHKRRPHLHLHQNDKRPLFLTLSKCDLVLHWI